MIISLVRRIQATAADMSGVFAYMLARSRSSNILIRILLLMLTIVCLPILILKSRRPMTSGKQGMKSSPNPQKDVYPLW